MVFGGVGTRRARLGALVGMIGAIAVAIAAASPAEAARKKRGKPAGGGYSPPYAALVVDARTGRTLHAVNEDAPRVPASITKVMTLYLLFEQLERGRFRMDTELPVSVYASRQAPSKIGLRPGSTIEVRDAIMALITKSANDASVVVAEAVGGSEEAFARMMTARARSLGMSRTTFYNPHGLPHSPPNITTARDLSILARAIQERFPRYYPMFSARTASIAGANFRNHNRLLGRVEGVDGIKTGYTRLSGFNLMTSAKADGRHIVSIVLGGRTGAHRDRIMADLVVAHLPRAATTGRATTLVAQADADIAPRPAPRAEPAPAPLPPQRAVVAQAAPVAAPAAVVVASAAPIPLPRPRIETEAPLPAAARAYAPTTTPVAVPRPLNVAPPPMNIAGVRPVTAAAAGTTPSAMRWSVGAQPADARVLRPPANVDVTSSIAKVAEPEPAAAPQPLPQPAVTAVAKAAPAPRQAEARPTVASGQWVIQLGATDDEAKARDILDRARSKASGQLASASPFTEKVQRGGATLFRARFAGFDDGKDAQSACARLKRDGFACFATRG